MLVYLIVEGDIPSNVDETAVLQRVFQRIRNLYKSKVAISMDQVEVSLERIGPLIPANSFFVAVIMPRRLLHFLCCIEPSGLRASTGLMQIGHVMGRTGWPLSLHGISGENL